MCHLLYSPSLYQKIDTEKLQCLNEAEEGSGKKVFRPWDERLDKSKVDYRVKLVVYNFTVRFATQKLVGIDKCVL